MDAARFRLRLITAGPDETFFCDLFGDPEVMRWIGPPLTGQDAAAAFARVSRHNRMTEPGHRYWVIGDQALAQEAGMVALVRKGASAEFGIMLRPAWWGAGVATTVVPGVLAQGFAVMGLEHIRVQREDDAQGQVMHRLLSKFGFERVAADAEGGCAPGRCYWALPRARWSALPHGDG
jgi:RimJ/RimL family protein N-acetyltransferase